MCAPSDSSEIVEEAAYAAEVAPDERSRFSKQAIGLLTEAEEVLERIRAAASLDYRMYDEASATLDAMIETLNTDGSGWSLSKELGKMRERNTQLALEAKKQEDEAKMDKPKGSRCHADPLGVACQGHDAFCVGCVEGPSEPDRMSGCWPNHPWKFTPREKGLVCERQWDNGINASLHKKFPVWKHVEKGVDAQMPCWRSCWYGASDSSTDGWCQPDFGCPVSRPNLYSWWNSLTEYRAANSLTAKAATMDKNGEIAVGRRPDPGLAEKDAPLVVLRHPKGRHFSLAEATSSVNERGGVIHDSDASIVATATGDVTSSGGGWRLGPPANSIDEWLEMMHLPTTSLGAEVEMFARDCEFATPPIERQMALHKRRFEGEAVPEIVFDWSNRLLWNGLGNDFGHAAHLLGLCFLQKKCVSLIISFLSIPRFLDY